MADLQLAEVLAPLSQVTDLGMGQPEETAIRTCLLATGLARRMNLPERDVADVYYTALLQHIGCTAYAHETAALLGGDDIGFRAAGARVDDENLGEVLAFFLTGIAKGAPPSIRAHAVFKLMRAGPSFPQQLYRSNCEVAVRTADRLGLPSGVQRGLNTIYARPDGKGTPLTQGEEIALSARYAQVAGQAILFHDLGGPDLAIAKIRKRAGTVIDADIAETFAHHGRDLMAEIDETDPLVAVIDAEPEPHQHVGETRMDRIARAFADVTDLKCPWLHGHSTGVGTLADAAARELGLPDSAVSTIRRAGYLHDLGRVGVPNGILDKPGPLTSTEWERVRLHPYHSERILSRSQVLAPLASLAGMHHERLDGSGYHRQCPASMIPVGARMLAAANMYQAMTQERPYRPAHSSAAAAEQLIAETERGRLDPDAVEALLQVAGHTDLRPERAQPHGLTGREIEVLRLVAHGRSTREIGETLFISPKTADHHVQHIYAKIGVSTRAGAAMFAMQHDLVQPRSA